VQAWQGAYPGRVNRGCWRRRIPRAKLCGSILNPYFSQGGGEAPLKAFACTGGFDYWAAIDGGDVAGECGGFGWGALVQSEDDASDAECEARGRGLLGLRRVGDGDSGEGGALRFRLGLGRRSRGVG